MEGGGLIDGAAVIVDRCGAAGCIDGRKETAATEAGDAQPVGLDHAPRLVEARSAHLVAPRGNRGDAVAETGIHRLAEIPLLAHRGQVDRQAFQRPGQGGQLTPPTARTSFIRWAARPGSESTRAASARRKSSARWRSDRALC